jgi:hypothetical protein
MLTMATMGPVQDYTTRKNNRMMRQADLENLAHKVLARHCHFRGRDDTLQIEQHDDVLVVRGCVPSFYLKQVLQTALMELDGVRWVDNQVDVVACDGLSSVRSAGLGW